METVDKLREASRGHEGICGTVMGNLAKLFGLGDELAHSTIIEAVADAVEAELQGYVELPKDADGEYIHIGDELRDAWHEQKQGEVQRLVLDRHGWWLMLKNNCERFYAHGFHEWHNCHHKPPTVEDVLREFALACEDAGNAGPEVERIAAEYAKRIRLAGDAE